MHEILAARALDQVRNDDGESTESPADELVSQRTNEAAKLSIRRSAPKTRTESEFTDNFPSGMGSDPSHLKSFNEEDWSRLEPLRAFVADLPSAN